MPNKGLPVITVKGTGKNSKVVLWERDAAHPNGEIFVSNDGKERQVALTKGVKERLRSGQMEEVVSAISTTIKKPDSKQVSKPTTGAPWVGYDEMTVDEVLAELQGADEATRGKALAYEQAKGDKARKGIVDKLTSGN